MTDIIAPLPFTLTNGTTADADQVRADLNQIRNDVNVQVPIAISAAVAGIVAGGYRGAVVYNVGNQIMPDGVETPVSFNTEEIDTDAIHSTSVNPSRFTVPTGVTKIRVSAQIRVSGFIPSGGYIQLWKNGGAISGLSPQKGVVDGETYIIFIPPTIVCVAGDYFQIILFTVSGQIITVSQSNTWAELQILG